MHSRIKRSPKGASLATVMMVVAMMLTLGFTVVAIAFNHLNLSFKSSNQTQADHLAEATLAKAIDRIVNDREYGLLGTAEEKTVRITRPSTGMFSSLPEGSEGLLTFDETYANEKGIPYSTNNRTEAGVNGVDGVRFDVLLIHHSLAVTTWADRDVGDRVNLEVDTMARYAARLAEAPR